MAKKRRENLYGKAGGESGDHFLTPKEIDAAEAVKEKYKTTSALESRGRSPFGFMGEKRPRDFQDTRLALRPARRFPLLQ
jgi:hypothetical protein